jgi:hypothetical protein
VNTLQGGMQMTISVVGKQKFSHAAVAEPETLSDEVMVFCPACKAFETVLFKGGTLVQTRKFTQYGAHIYHDCGSNEPCRLYMTI